MISVSHVQNEASFSKGLVPSWQRPPEISQELEEVLSSSPSEQAIQKWLRQLQEDRTSAEDEERSGRASEVSISEMVQQTEILLVEDGRHACKESVERADMSVGRIHAILHRDLDKQKKFSKGVPDF